MGESNIVVPKGDMSISLIVLAHFIRQTDSHDTACPQRPRPAPSSPPAPSPLFLPQPLPHPPPHSHSHSPNSPPSPSSPPSLPSPPHSSHSAQHSSYCFAPPAALRGLLLVDRPRRQGRLCVVSGPAGSVSSAALLRVRVPQWTGWVLVLVLVLARAPREREREREPGTVDRRGWRAGGCPMVVLGPGVAAQRRPSGCLVVEGLRVSGAGRRGMAGLGMSFLVARTLRWMEPRAGTGRGTGTGRGRSEFPVVERRPSGEFASAVSPR